MLTPSLSCTAPLHSITCHFQPAPNKILLDHHPFFIVNVYVYILHFYLRSASEIFAQIPECSMVVAGFEFFVNVFVVCQNSHNSALCFLLFFSSKGSFVSFSQKQGNIYGILCGIGMIVAFVYAENYRAKERKRLAEMIAALSKLTLEDSRRIFPKEYFPPWVIFSNRQNLDWLNYELKKVWPFVNKAASELIKETLEPILEQYIPSMLASLKFSTLTLGTVAPQFTGVRMVEPANNGAILELEVQWDGDLNIVLDIKTLMGVALPVQVKNIGFTGVFQLIFRPLVNELPCFGAFTYSLLEKEKLDFTLKVIGGDIMSIPGLAGAIEDTIKDALEGSLMWPARNIIPILPGDYSEMEIKPVGVLEVKLIQAKNLKNKEFIGKSDPFCVIYTRPIRDRIKKSKTINNELNPVWNEHFEFEVEDISTQHLQIKICDDEGLRGAETMGCARIKLKDLKPGELKDLWLPVVKDFEARWDAKYRGEVHVELRYLPFGMENELRNSFSRNETTSLEKVISMDMNGHAIPSLQYINSSKRGRIVRGVLSVTVKCAENLIPVDLNKKADPYVILQMKKSDVMKKTRVVPKSLNPIWDQTFHFVVEDALHDLLIVEVWDHDTIGKDFMGKCVLTLSKLLLEGEYDADLTLEGVKSGQLYLQLKWKPQPYYNGS